MLNLVENKVLPYLNDFANNVSGELDPTKLLMNSLERGMIRYYNNE